MEEACARRTSTSPHGKGRTQLTSLPTTESQPAWSPDGTRIVFTSGTRLRVMNAAGSGQQLLTDLGQPDNADWSQRVHPGTWHSSRCHRLCQGRHPGALPASRGTASPGQPHGILRGGASAWILNGG